VTDFSCCVTRVRVVAVAERARTRKPPENRFLISLRIHETWDGAVQGKLRGMWVDGRTPLFRSNGATGAYLLYAEGLRLGFHPGVIILFDIIVVGSPLTSHERVYSLGVQYVHSALLSRVQCTVHSSLTHHHGLGSWGPHTEDSLAQTYGCSTPASLDPAPHGTAVDRPQFLLHLTSRISINAGIV
jgi:hypothetical protein